MSDSFQGRGFVIDGMTRTGSTTLARLLSCHDDINCLMEPFHPRRYQGQFHQMALSSGSVATALALIWHRWSGIKHVWEADTGWPFVGRTELNDTVVLGGWPVIFLRRRNLLRRYVSATISRRLAFWVGTREEFLARLEGIVLPELVPETVRIALEQDMGANEHRTHLLSVNGIRWMSVFYEDLYDAGMTIEQRRLVVNSIFQFLGYRQIDEETFMKQCLPLLNPDTYRWGSTETYLRVPGIMDVECRVGSDRTGWLFRE
jgi:hypothetical protein